MSILQQWEKKIRKKPNGKRKEQKTFANHLFAF